jgi:ferredoxin
MHIEVNWDRCVSNGLCCAAAPTVFELKENDELDVLIPNPPDELKDAVQAAALACPMAAIRLEE